MTRRPPTGLTRQEEALVLFSSSVWGVAPLWQGSRRCSVYTVRNNPFVGIAPGTTLRLRRTEVTVASPIGGQASVLGRVSRCGTPLLLPPLQKSWRSDLPVVPAVGAAAALPRRRVLGPRRLGFPRMLGNASLASR